MKLDHIGVSVGDLAAAEGWYTAAFGLRVELRLRVEPVDLDIVMLIHDEYGYRFELLHRPGSVAAPPAGSAAAAVLARGYGHVAFGVPRLQSAFDRLLELGAQPVMAPCPSPEPGVNMAYVADPEGNLIELVERAR
ncbi:VOC family protein [Actinoplanes derwentensis]|uniref:Glyoxalase/Bleomycin resistance protein/Dioxygenase superfamily protein n=1 Tax=Actinoplanes derwentensis TaxID=113562 RepID=A0A1H1UR61_9ACTN|nr:VOC family protein [Actinoplanes derwentensis]GID88126.1 lactoylglutathione lyase [Actinoplanes derwentensis]SDS74349.1 Glyoxalase/Bleomycin resistance protein/Dioxygenase superfamily protein [Actinoplanes derwentensis]